MMDLRKIDALVAEKVMYYRRGHWPSEDKTRVFTWRDDSKKTVYDDDCLPWFSSSIEAAWEVVEKLKDEGWHFNIATSRPLFTVMMHAPGGGEVPLVIEKAETAPLAICLAALKAKGIDVERGEGE